MFYNIEFIITLYDTRKLMSNILFQQLHVVGSLMNMFSIILVTNTNLCYAQIFVRIGSYLAKTCRRKYLNNFL